MATWQIPTAADVQTLMHSGVIAAGNEKDDQTSNERLPGLLGLVVARVRGAIDAGGKVALSATEGSVPPEGMFHTIVLTVNALSASTPDLARFALGDAFQKLVQGAEDWLKAVQEGKMMVSEPGDPVTGGVQLATVVESGGERLTRELCVGL